MSTTALVTAEEFYDMSFDVPVELVKGEIVEMTLPGGWHGRICSRIAHLLESWAEPEFEFEVFSNDTGVLLERGPDTVRGPDVFVIRRHRLPNGKIPRRLFDVAPDVAIEVKSRSDLRPEILRKVSQFLAAGTQEVWIVDPDHFRVHAYHVDDEPMVYNRDEKLTSPFLSGFECGVSELFRGLE